MSELEAVVSEDVCWRQIKMTCDTNNKSLEEAFNFFCMEIQPKMQPYADTLNKKIISSPFTKELDTKKYFTYLRSVKKSIDLFREAKYSIAGGACSASATIRSDNRKDDGRGEWQGIYIATGIKIFRKHDRQLREEVYRKINARRLEDKQY